MRKTTAALATAALTAASLIGPIGAAGARPAQEVPEVSCGTVGPPVCEQLATVTGILEPLQPVLALTAPALGQLGSTIESLGELGLSGGSVPAADLSAAASSMITQLDALSAPSATLLDATGQRAALRSALQQLVDALAALPAVGDTVAPAVGEVTGPVAPTTPAPAAEPAASPESAPAGSSSASGSSSRQGSSVGSTSSSAPTGFGGSLFRSSDRARSQSARVPFVPLGGSLNLGSLGIPTFRITTPAESVAGTAAANQERVESVVLPAARAAAADALPDDSRAMAAMGALSALLLAGGLLIDRLRKQRSRHIIPS